LDHERQQFPLEKGQPYDNAEAPAQGRLIPGWSANASPVRRSIGGIDQRRRSAGIREIEIIFRF
jgi:hypothetical protein